ncbi:adhesion G-protein coupled receptor G4-like isoform X2 [Zootoca vivipara]|uniref:adhesion G-protein coupled receptor G4-like isoform X2 n=1 Tax=Zootoca vivipara TaxID=8524 RepID=UPI001591F9EB|nr:adhesion G-protein coupled receptor G4-like isoform X2 [Zootoca vivipara]
MMRGRMGSLAGSSSDKTLCSLVVILVGLFLLSETASLKGKQLVLSGQTEKYPSLAGRIAHDLHIFTVCIYLSKTNRSVGTWAAFSYDISSSSRDPKDAELALFASNDTLQMSLFGTLVDLGKDVVAPKMRQMCCVWDGYKSLLEVFHDGGRMKSEDLPLLKRKHLKPNGTFRIGCLHKKQASPFRFVGTLHYFQMWSSVIEEQQMKKCFSGDVISWEGDYWSLNGATLESDHHQDCGSRDFNHTSLAPPLTSKAPDPSVTVSPSRSDEATPKAEPTASTAVPSNSYVKIPTSGRDGTTHQQELIASTTRPDGATPQGVPTQPTWYMPTSQYAETAPKSTWTVPTSKPTQVSSTSRYDGATQQASETVSVLPFTNTKLITESKASTIDINAKTTPQTFWSTPTPTGTMPVSVTFYNIQMNFSVFSDPPETFDYYDVKKLSTNWLMGVIQLFHDPEFVVTNHNIKANARERMKTGRDEKLAPESFSSKSVVKATSHQPRENIRKMLQDTLSGSHTEKPLSMESKDVAVVHFDPKTCSQHTPPSKYKGTYEWLETAPATVASQSCKMNGDQLASRACLININTGNAYWRRQDLTLCQLVQKLPDNIMELKNMTITVENAEEVADHILILLNSTKLSKEKIEVLVSKLTDIANCEEISEALARKALQIIDIILTQATNAQGLRGHINSILQVLEQIGFKLKFSGRSESIVLPRLALALLRPDPMNFQGVAFGVTSYDSAMDPQIDIRQAPFEMALASIFLPELLRHYLGAQSFEPEDHTKIQFSFFGTTSPFQEKNKNLITYVVGASVENVSVQNLSEPVNIILQHINSTTGDESVHCVFWNFKKNDNQGGWDTSGCEVQRTNSNYTICNCSHLTHFGVLLDVYRTVREDKVLTLVSHVGCGLSSIFLGLALVVYLSIDKLRGDDPSRILVHLCSALLMLNLAFLLDSWLASFQVRGLCITVSVALHYFLLAAFTWMGLEAIHMYYALVRVFNTYVPHYMLKVSLAGWGIPAVIVSTVLIISTDFYGVLSDPLSSSPITPFCWIRDDLVFYISVLAYFCLVFLMNTVMFIAVLLQIHTMKTKSPGRVSNWNHSFLHGLKRVASLMVLLSLTWSFAFFSVGPTQTLFSYLFAICNTFQGFFIFVFHCLMKENVRKQCRVHFCLGKFRLSYSDWSSSATTLGYHHHSQNTSPHSLKSQSSCTASSTSNGSGSLPGAAPETDDVLHSTRHASFTHQKVKLPRVRRMSPMDAELHCTQKTSFLP